jgi:NTP pyrophosphatase (non-canonical NTP hydrolase)
MSYPHYNVDLEKTQEEILEWSTRNFGSVPNWQIPLRISSFLGMVEEIGEIAHSILKMTQGIRGTKEEHIEKIKDGIADLMVFLLDFCGRNEMNADTLLRDVWNKVRERDWTKDKLKGGEE